MDETVLWGTRKGDQAWDEQIITITHDPEHLKRARTWAEANGFVNLRTREVDDETPNFAATVQI
jgi:hypothetical protein